MKPADAVLSIERLPSGDLLLMRRLPSGEIEREVVLSQKALLQMVTDSEQAALRAVIGAPAIDLWAAPEWLEIVRAYRACKTERPSQLAVAAKMGFQNEDSLRSRLRRLEITRWQKVHALIAAEPKR